MGNFNCFSNKLTSLEFCPKIINGYFDCSFNQLTSLEFSPQQIKGDFICSANKLTNLKYLPKIIKGSLDISDNKIKEEELYTLNSHIIGGILSNFGNKEKFLNLVQEQKILKEKEEINSNLYSTQNSQLVKKRL